VFVCVTVIKNSEWDLLDWSFIFVEATFLLSFPIFIISMISSWLEIYRSVTSPIKIPLTLSCFIYRFTFVVSSKSLSFSIYISTILTFTSNSMLSFEFSILLKMVRTIRGTIPCSSIFSMSGPCMVKVLPDPVWPYAKIVPLNPSRTPVVRNLTFYDRLSSLIINLLLMRINIKNSIKCKLITRLLPCFLSLLLLTPSVVIVQLFLFGWNWTQT